MIRHLALFCGLLASGACPIRAAEADPAVVMGPVRLPTGTVIPLILRQALSTKTNVKGDLFDMSVAHDVSAMGRVVIPAGTRAVGEITRCEKKGAFGRSGKIEARVLYVVIGDRTIRTSGALSARGQGAAAETVLATVAVGALSFIVTGRSAAIAAGSPLQAIIEHGGEF